jgi:predicted lipoprotein
VNAVAARPGKRKVPVKLILWAAAIVVLIALALDTTTRSDKAPRITEGGQVAFNPSAYGAKTYPKVAAAIEKKAVPLTTLVPAIKGNPDAAGKQYGSRQGSSPYNFAVTGEGVAGTATNGLLPVKVKGVPKSTTVSLQIGPAINGTALRDAVGFITFNQFINQVDYADAATALNHQVKAKVLKGVDPASLKGKTVKFTGAFSFLAPTIVTVTPTRLEAS